MKKQFLACLMLLSVALMPTNASAITFKDAAYRTTAGLTGLTLSALCILMGHRVIGNLTCDPTIPQDFIPGLDKMASAPDAAEVPIFSICIACMGYCAYHCYKAAYNGLEQEKKAAR